MKSPNTVKKLKIVDIFSNIFKKYVIVVRRSRQLRAERVKRKSRQCLTADPVSTTALNRPTLQNQPHFCGLLRDAPLDIQRG